MLRIKDSSDHIEPFELEQLWDQTTPSIPFEFEKLTDDLQIKVLCKALFGNEKLSSVNKSWRKMIKGIIHHALPMYKRDELIHGLYYRVIRLDNDKKNERIKNLMTNYQNNLTLTSSSAVKFLYDFLNPNEAEDPIEDQSRVYERESEYSKYGSESESEYETKVQACEDESEIQTRMTQKINEMIEAWGLHPTITCLDDSKVFLKSLLKNRKIEEAFAFAARMDDDQFAHSILIQEYLLNVEDGLGLSLDQAYKLTEALNTKATRISAITAFVRVGCKDFDIPAEATIPIMDALMKHPFITFIKNNTIKNLPKSAVFYLIGKINILHNCEYENKSEIECESNCSSDCEFYDLDQIKCYLIKILFKMIPIDFDFIEESEDNSEECADLIFFYQDPLYSHGLIPQSNQLMTETATDKFIRAINKIEHAGLKKQIFENAMEDFYQDQPDMRVWLPTIERIEKLTDQVQNGFQQLVIQYLYSDLKKFRIVFDKVNCFSRLVALLKESPDWIKGFEPRARNFQDKYDFQNATDRALNIYKVVVKLLTDHDEKELARRIIKNVKSEAMKIELENVLDH